MLGEKPLLSIRLYIYDVADISRCYKNNGTFYCIFQLQHLQKEAKHTFHRATLKVQASAGIFDIFMS